MKYWICKIPTFTFLVLFSCKWISPSRTYYKDSWRSHMLCDPDDERLHAYHRSTLMMICATLLWCNNRRRENLIIAIYTRVLITISNYTNKISKRIFHFFCSKDWSESWWRVRVLEVERISIHLNRNSNPYVTLNEQLLPPFSVMCCIVAWVPWNAREKRDVYDLYIRVVRIGGKKKLYYVIWRARGAAPPEREREKEKKVERRAHICMIHEGVLDTGLFQDGLDQ